MYKRILVPIDGSATAGLGLTEAVKLAKSLGAQVRLIHIMNQTPWVTPDAPSTIIGRMLDELRGSAESILHEATKAVRGAGVEVDSRLIEALGAEAGEYIIDEARSWPAELIVCGTHGRRGLRRMVMGSDAEYILRRSPVPVMLVRGTEVAERPS